MLADHRRIDRRGMAAQPPPDLPPQAKGVEIGSRADHGIVLNVPSRDLGQRAHLVTRMSELTAGTENDELALMAGLRQGPDRIRPRGARRIRRFRAAGADSARQVFDTL